MTAVSCHYYDLICKYCVHCGSGGCRKDVPWYAVSLECGFFEDGKPVGCVESTLPRLGFRLEDVLVDTV